MWKPDESLDDYIVTPPPEVTSEPPRSVVLQKTGEVEVLKPLTYPEVPAGYRGYRRAVRQQPLWFRRFLAVGSGALVMMALVLLSAILVGIDDPGSGPDVARNEKPVDTLTQPEELFTFDLSIPLTFVSPAREVVRSRTARRPARSSVTKPRRQLRPRLQAEEPDFVPTTLVIYAENGVINTRIEPWLQAGKTTNFNN